MWFAILHWWCTAASNPQFWVWVHIFLILTARMFFLPWTYVCHGTWLSNCLKQDSSNKNKQKFVFYFWCMEIHPSKHKQNLCFAESGRAEVDYLRQVSIKVSLCNKFPSCHKNKACNMGKILKFKECCFLCLVGIPSKLIWIPSNLDLHPLSLRCSRTSTHVLELYSCLMQQCLAHHLIYA